MSRAIAPVVGSVLLLLCVLGLATTLAIVAIGFSSGLSAPTSQVSLSLSVDAEENRFVVAHEGGESLDARSLSVVVEVEGEPLDHQPPVPFFSASGFEPGPTGVFNVGYSGEWDVGESASFTLNPNTNGPVPERGSSVSVTVYEEERPVARAGTTAR